MEKMEESDGTGAVYYIWTELGGLSEVYWWPYFGQKCVNVGQAIKDFDYFHCAEPTRHFDLVKIIGRTRYEVIKQVN